jgi:hypothetical protein
MKLSKYQLIPRHARREHSRSRAADAKVHSAVVKVHVPRVVSTRTVGERSRRPVIGRHRARKECGINCRIISVVINN